MISVPMTLRHSRTWRLAHFLRASARHVLGALDVDPQAGTAPVGHGGDVADDDFGDTSRARCTAAAVRSALPGPESMSRIDVTNTSIPHQVWGDRLEAGRAEIRRWSTVLRIGHDLARLGATQHAELWPHLISGPVDLAVEAHECFQRWRDEFHPTHQYGEAR